MRDEQTSGQSLASGLNSFFFLNIDFFMTVLYFALLVSGFALAFGLSFILIGIPLFAFMLAAMRRIAMFDRQLVTGILRKPTPRFDPDIQPQRCDLLGYIMAQLTNPFTWQSAFYVFGKFMLTTMTFSLAWSVFPFFILEALILMPLGITNGLVTSAILRLMAGAIDGFGRVLIDDNAADAQALKPKRQSGYYEDDATELLEKPKRRERLVGVDEPEVAYYIDDEGEIVRYERDSQR